MLHIRDGSNDYNHALSLTSISGIADMVTKEIPAFGGQMSLAEVVVEEFCRFGLLNWSRKESIATYRAQGEPLVTQLGQEFLEFISETDHAA